MDRDQTAAVAIEVSEIKFFVNGEEVVHEYRKPPDREVFKLSVGEILTSAGFKPPEDYELTRDSGGKPYSDVNEEIPVDFGEHFTATHKGQTPVSRPAMSFDEFAAHLRELGVRVETLQGADGQTYLVARDVELPKGALRGKRCDIAIQQTGMVPFVPPAAIHTRPHLVPMDKHEPLRTMKSDIGPDWQYWSRQYNHRATPRDLWAHVLTVLCDDRWPTS